MGGALIGRGVDMFNPLNAELKPLIYLLTYLLTYSLTHLLTPESFLTS